MLITIGVFADTAKAAIEGTKISEVLTLDGAEGTGNAMGLLGAPIDQVAGRRPRRRRRAPVLVGHDRPAEGRDAHALQPRRQHRPDAPDLRIREHEVMLSFLPFFHIYGMQVLMNTGLSIGRHDRDDAAVRPAAGARTRAGRTR